MLPYMEGRLELKDFIRYKEFPDYLSDLNAMHEAEKLLTLAQKDRYESALLHMVKDNDICYATSAQRAEAFLRTLGLWVDS